MTKLHTTHKFNHGRRNRVIFFFHKRKYTIIELMTKHKRFGFVGHQFLWFEQNL